MGGRLRPPEEREEKKAVAEEEGKGPANPGEEGASLAEEKGKKRWEETDQERKPRLQAPGGQLSKEENPSREGEKGSGKGESFHVTPDERLTPLPLPVNSWKEVCSLLE